MLEQLYGVSEMIRPPSRMVQRTKALGKVVTNHNFNISLSRAVYSCIMQNIHQTTLTNYVVLNAFVCLVLLCCTFICTITALQSQHMNRMYKTCGINFLGNGICTKQAQAITLIFKLLLLHFINVFDWVLIFFILHRYTL